MDPDFMKEILAGNYDLTRMYVGSYQLVRSPTGRLYRCKGDIPEGFIEIKFFGKEPVYDKDGFLMPKYWALPRISEGAPH